LTLKETEYPGCSILERLGMEDISALSKILVYSTPKDIVQLAASSKKMRVLCGSRICGRALCQGIIALKNRTISYYRKHVSYFESLRERVPTEILKTAYFRYHILKETAGHEIKQALNASALIFEGQFEGEELYTGLPDFNKEIPLKLNFKQASFLEVDNSIIERFKEVRSG